MFYNVSELVLRKLVATSCDFKVGPISDLTLMVPLTWTWLLCITSLALFQLH